MKKVMRIASLLLLGGAYISAFGQNVYKTVDAGGNVAYTDRPPLTQSANEQLELVAGLDISRTDTAQISAMNEQQAAARQTQKDGSAEAADAGPEAQQRAAIREANCATVQNRVAKYAEGARIYSTNPDGSRVFLSDAEVAALKAETDGLVKEWCD